MTLSDFLSKDRIHASLCETGGTPDEVAMVLADLVPAFVAEKVRPVFVEMLWPAPGLAPSAEMLEESIHKVLADVALKVHMSGEWKHGQTLSERFLVSISVDTKGVWHGAIHVYEKAQSSLRLRV